MKNTDPVIVATTTFYKSKDDYRFPFAEKMIIDAKKNGHMVILVDGSPEIIRAHFRSLGALVYEETAKGIGPSRRELYGHVQNWISSHVPEFSTAPEVILWLEPEKYDLLRFVPEIAGPILKKHASIVVPRRTSAAMASYPKFQQASERTANMVYKFVVKVDVDIFFGPVAFHRDVIRYFMNCNPSHFGAADTYIQHYAPLFAMKNNHTIMSVDVDFRYPEKQREAEEGFDLKAMVERRNEQLETLVDGYLKLSPHLGDL